jgi:hypothetical protein
MNSREDSGDLYRGLLLPVDDSVIVDKKYDIVAIPLSRVL